MLTKVQQWGNSLALRIPRSFAAEAEVEAGSVVDISVGKDGLRVRPVRRRKYALRKLLEGVKRKNGPTRRTRGVVVGFVVLPQGVKPQGA